MGAEIPGIAPRVRRGVQHSNPLLSGGGEADGGKKGKEIVVVSSSGVGGSGLFGPFGEAIDTEGVIIPIGGGMIISPVSSKSRVSFVISLGVKGGLFGQAPAICRCLAWYPRFCGLSNSPKLNCFMAKYSDCGSGLREDLV